MQLKYKDIAEECHKSFNCLSEYFLSVCKMMFIK